MSTSLQLINNHKYSEQTLERISKQKKEKGKIKVLCSYPAFIEAYPNAESVFQKAFNVMRLKANDKCICGNSISNLKNGYRRIEGTYKYRCRGCNRTIAPLSFTPLERCKVDLHSVISVIYFSIQNKYHLTAKNVERLLACKYDVALRLMHRIMQWKGAVVGTYTFENTVIQSDELHMKIPSGFSSLKGRVKFPRGLSGLGKAPVVVFTSDDGRAQSHVVDDITTSTMKELFSNYVDTSTVVWTDGAKCYDFLSNKNYIHKSCNHSSKPKQYSTPDGVHVNRTENFNQQAKIKQRVHRGLSHQHLQKYMDQVAFMFSNRFNDAHTAIESLFEALPALNKAIEEREKLKLKNND